MAHNQTGKKMQGTYIMRHEGDDISIEFINGFLLVRNKQNVHLMQCSPNQTVNGIPICRYRVTVSIEAMKENENE